MRAAALLQPAPRSARRVPYLVTIQAVPARHLPVCDNPFMNTAPGAIPETHGITRDGFERDIVPRGAPMVVRGLVSDWPAVACGRESAEAICRYLIERDNGTPVDAILLRPDEKGRIFY